MAPTVQADRLRNLRALHLDLPGGLTVLTGHNGQGKTSLLEAIYLLGTGYSFRTRRVDDLVARHGGPLRVSGDVASRSGRDTLAVVIDGGVRRLLSAGNECRSHRLSRTPRPRGDHLRRVSTRS